MDAATSSVTSSSTRRAAKPEPLLLPPRSPLLRPGQIEAAGEPSQTAHDERLHDLHVGPEVAPTTSRSAREPPACRVTRRAAARRGSSRGRRAARPPTRAELVETLHARPPRSVRTMASSTRARPAFGAQRHGERGVRELPVDRRRHRGLDQGDRLGRVVGRERRRPANATSGSLSRSALTSWGRAAARSATVVRRRAAARADGRRRRRRPGARRGRPGRRAAGAASRPRRRLRTPDAAAA